jgi:hypothetical protein
MAPFRIAEMIKTCLRFQQIASKAKVPVQHETRAFGTRIYRANTKWGRFRENQN